MKYVTTFMLCMIASLFIEVNDVRSHETIEMIPDEAIRLRILANSNEAKDQETKLIVRDAVSLHVSELVDGINEIDEARRLINQHIDQIKQTIEITLREQGVNQSFTISFRNDVPFPEKNYGNYLYPEGLYEAILITIGEGEGDNWWCVLFPPLCFVEYSTEEIDDIEAMDISGQGDEIDVEEEDKDKEEEDPVISFFLLDWLGI